MKADLKQKVDNEVRGMNSVCENSIGCETGSIHANYQHPTHL